MDHMWCGLWDWKPVTLESVFITWVATPYVATCPYPGKDKDSLGGTFLITVNHLTIFNYSLLRWKYNKNNTFFEVFYI